MYSNLKINAGRILLSVQYLIAYFAVFSIGSSMSLSWLTFSLTNYCLLALISRNSPKTFFLPVETQARRKVLPRNYERFLAFLLTTTCLFVLTANPAYSQFFGNAQNFIATCFPQAASLVPLVFNVLRFVLIMYLGISLVQGVAAIQNGQNLSAVAIPPLLVVVIVTAADFASTLIIGGATC